MMTTKITVNRAKCLKCNDVVESNNRHDFVMCSCESMSVDGGTDYIGRCGNPKFIQDLSEYEEAPKNERKL